jgi:hypothetical protein
MAGQGGDMNTMPEVIENKEVQVISPMQQAHDFLKAGGDLVTMEKMMDLQDRFEKNEAKKLFFAAMVIAQKRMPVIYEGRNNKVTHSTYAAYKDIVRDSKPIYTGAGLAISFYEEPATKEDHIKLCADVYHEKGHSQTYSISLAIDDKGPKGTVVKTKIHGTKSAISYGRGILLCNIFNIPTNDDVDDDGNGAGIMVEYLSVDQAIDITDKLKEAKGNIEMFLKNFKCESVETIPLSQYGRALNMLKAKAGAV